MNAHLTPTRPATADELTPIEVMSLRAPRVPTFDMPRLPSDVPGRYSRRQGEIDVATLGWLAFQDRDRLELQSHEDETWSVFDALVGDAVAEDAISAYDAVDRAADELLPRGVR